MPASTGFRMRLLLTLTEMPRGSRSECWSCSLLSQGCTNGGLKPIFRISPTFFSPIALCLVTAPRKPEAGPKQIPNTAYADRFHDSISDDGCKVDRLPGALSDFLEPRSWIGAMNYTPQESEPLGCIIAVSPEVVLRDLGIQGEKGIQVPGLGEDLRCVSKLRGFYDDGFLDVENVFRPKQIDPACPA